MEDKDNREIPGFMHATIKHKPVNKRKLLRKTVITICLAILFGLVASFTILVLEPALSRWLYPEEAPDIVIFPEDQDEIKPEDMIPTEEVIKQDTDIAKEEEEFIKLLENYQLDKDNYVQLYTALDNYVAELSTSMVTVTGITSDLDWFKNSYETKGKNYGVLIADNGLQYLILTCIDDLQTASEIEITFCNLYRTNATILQVDVNSDIAILAVEKEGLPEYVVEDITIAPMGSSAISASVGVPVIALGSPLGVADSIGYGMIVADPVSQNIIDANYQLYTTNIYGSLTGKGVLFNLSGEIIGIIGIGTETIDIKNLISAIGISELKSRITLLSNDKTIPYLGIYGISVSEQAHENQGVPYGAFINQIAINSPAMYGGIQSGDIITKLGNENITSYNELIRAILLQEAGSSVKVTLQRQVQDTYKQMEVTVTLQ